MCEMLAVRLRQRGRVAKPNRPRNRSAVNSCDDPRCSHRVAQSHARDIAVNPTNAQFSLPHTSSFTSASPSAPPSSPIPSSPPTSSSLTFFTTPSPSPSSSPPRFLPPTFPSFSCSSSSEPAFLAATPFFARGVFGVAGSFFARAAVFLGVSGAAAPAAVEELVAAVTFFFFQLYSRFSTALGVHSVKPSAEPRVSGRRWQPCGGRECRTGVWSKRREKEESGKRKYVPSPAALTRSAIFSHSALPNEIWHSSNTPCRSWPCQRNGLTNTRLVGGGGRTIESSSVVHFLDIVAVGGRCCWGNLGKRCEQRCET